MNRYAPPLDFARADRLAMIRAASRPFWTPSRLILAAIIAGLALAIFDAFTLTRQRVAPEPPAQVTPRVHLNLRPGILTETL